MSGDAQGLRRVLGVADASWLVAGSMIGAGIFYTPGLVAEKLPGMLWPLLAWTLGGVLALCGACVYAELGTRMPRAGGDYLYLARVLGPPWGFLTGWSAFTVTFSAAVAAMVVVALDYLSRALPGDGGWAQLGIPLGDSRLNVVAPLVVLALAWANTAGATVSGKVTAMLTGVPVAVLVGLYGFGLFSGSAAQWPARPLAAPAGSWIVALATALIPIHFTYTGWNAAAYLAGEIRDPGRNLARALVLGTGWVALLYLLINLVILVSVPADRLAGSTTAGADAARALLGPRAERVLSLAIALAVLGTANVTLMAGARIYYAMSLDGLAPRSLSRVSRRGSPTRAVWAGGCWTALLALFGNVGVLVGWTTLAILLLSSLTVVALFVARTREPEATFRCPGYPWVPIAYLVTALGVACASAVTEPRLAIYGILLVGAGLPVYGVIRSRAPVSG